MNLDELEKESSVVTALVRVNPQPISVSDEVVSPFPPARVIARGEDYVKWWESRSESGRHGRCFIYKKDPETGVMEQIPYDLDGNMGVVCD